jgi:hypothetical protein
MEAGFNDSQRGSRRHGYAYLAPSRTRTVLHEVELNAQLVHNLQDPDREFFMKCFEVPPHAAS